MERLPELIEDQKEEADADMLSLLEELVGERAAEKEAHDALGRSETRPGILEPDPRTGGTRGRRARRRARRWTKPVAKHATVSDWSERDDVRRDIR